MTDALFKTVITENGKQYILEYTGGESTAVLVPAKIGGRPVTGIANGAFTRKKLFTDTVEIGAGIEEIGDFAFAGCVNLAHVIIPSSVKIIGGFAFAGCTSLTEIHFSGNKPMSHTTMFDKSNTSLVVYHFASSSGWGNDGDLWNGRTTRIELENIDDGDAYFAPPEDLHDYSSYADERQQEETFFQETQEIEYQQEFGAFNRAEIMYDKHTSLRHAANPQEAFKIRLGKAFDKYSTSLGMARNELDTMNVPITLMDHVEFKNPIAYMLGYYVLNKGTGEIDKPRFTKASNFLDQISITESFVAEDIIRYAIYWQTSLLQFIRPL